MPSGTVRSTAALACAGGALVLAQYVMVREVGSTIFSTEIVLFVATVVTLAGPSLAYASAGRASERTLAGWATLALLSQLALPTGLRALVALAAAHPIARAFVMAVPVVVGLFAIGFPAVVLPRRIGPELGLGAAYAGELAGALLGLGAIALAPSYRVILGVHAALAVLVVYAATGRARLSLACATLAVVAVVAYPRLDRAAAESFFRREQRLSSPVVVETSYSPYQRIDVVDDARGSRSLFLDGVYFFRARGSEGFNVFLADVPGALLPSRGEALVVGSGSFLSAALLHRRGFDVTVVEIDAEVARMGFFHFADVHGLPPGAVRVEIADARRWLAETHRTFDLVVLDVPAPFHVRTGLLHAEAFYRQVAQHLRPGGVVSISLCQELDGPLARAIAAGATRVFSEVLVVEPRSLGIGHLYAGAALPFDEAALGKELARDPHGGAIYGDAAVRARVAHVAPLGPDNLLPVLLLARAPLLDALHGE